jgi:hypothetical protein
VRGPVSREREQSLLPDDRDRRVVSRGRRAGRVLERRCLEHVAQPDPADDCTLDHRATDGHDTAGRPALTMFNAPSSYTCLTQDPTQAQVTLGWSAPSATQRYCHLPHA